MSQRKRLLSIDYISDDDCGIYRIGEIDVIPNYAIEEHIKTFGEFGYEQWRDLAIRILTHSEKTILNYRNYCSSDQAAEFLK